MQIGGELGRHLLVHIHPCGTCIQKQYEEAGRKGCAYHQEEYNIVPVPKELVNQKRRISFFREGKLDITMIQNKENKGFKKNKASFRWSDLEKRCFPLSFLNFS